jgi:hypothetical protein
MKAKASQQCAYESKYTHWIQLEISMNIIRITAIALLACLPLFGCSKNDPAPAADPANEPTTLLGKAVKGATDGAREELTTNNIDLNATGQPSAKITPTGEFLIDGKAVAVNAEQRKILLEYRKHVITVADAAIGVGLDSADLAGKALNVSIQGGFSNDADQIDRKIEAEVKDIKQSAKSICALLPAMKVTQDELAAALPEFKPYATMIQSDVDNCMNDFNAAGVGKSVAAATDNDTAEFAGGFVEGFFRGYDANQAEHKGKDDEKGKSESTAQQSEAVSEKQ